MVSEPVAAGDRVPVTAVWLGPHHVGPSRMWVELGRRWAARGVSTVRVDPIGLGESDGFTPRPFPDRNLYSVARAGHLRAVLEQLAAQGLPPRFIVGGYCAGAYWALHAAVADQRVIATMLVNLYAFRYTDELVREREAARALGVLAGRVGGN